MVKGLTLHFQFVLDPCHIKTMSTLDGESQSLTKINTTKKKLQTNQNQHFKVSKKNHRKKQRSRFHCVHNLCVCTEGIFKWFLLGGLVGGGGWGGVLHSGNMMAKGHARTCRSLRKTRDPSWPTGSAFPGVVLVHATLAAEWFISRQCPHTHHHQKAAQKTAAFGDGSTWAEGGLQPRWWRSAPGERFIQGGRKLSRPMCGCLKMQTPVLESQIANSGRRRRDLRFVRLHFSFPVPWWVHTRMFKKSSKSSFYLKLLSRGDIQSSAVQAVALRGRQ